MSSTLHAGLSLHSRPTELSELAFCSNYHNLHQGRFASLPCRLERHSASRRPSSSKSMPSPSYSVAMASPLRRGVPRFIMGVVTKQDAARTGTHSPALRVHACPNERPKISMQRQQKRRLTGSCAPSLWRLGCHAASATILLTTAVSTAPSGRRGVLEYVWPLMAGASFKQMSSWWFKGDVWCEHGAGGRTIQTH